MASHAGGTAAPPLSRAAVLGAICRLLVAARSLRSNNAALHSMSIIVDSPPSCPRALHRAVQAGDLREVLLQEAHGKLLNRRERIKGVGAVTPLELAVVELVGGMQLRKIEWGGGIPHSSSSVYGRPGHTG